MLTVERARELLRYDSETGLLTWLQSRRNPTRGGWGAEVGDPAGKQYAPDRPVMVWVEGRLWRAHILAWALHHGVFPDDQIDHINGDPTDNRIDNLRLAPQPDNVRNRRVSRNNSSGVMGVQWRRDKQRWRTYIERDGVRVSLGQYKDFFESVCVRKAAEIKYGFHENHGRAAVAS